MFTRVITAWTKDQIDATPQNKMRLSNEMLPRLSVSSTEQATIQSDCRI